MYVREHRLGEGNLSTNIFVYLLKCYTYWHCMRRSYSQLKIRSSSLSKAKRNSAFESGDVLRGLHSVFLYKGSLRNILPLITFRYFPVYLWINLFLIFYIYFVLFCACLCNQQFHSGYKLPRCSRAPAVDRAAEVFRLAG